MNIAGVSIYEFHILLREIKPVLLLIWQFPLVLFSREETHVMFAENAAYNVANLGINKENEVPYCADVQVMKFYDLRKLMPSLSLSLSLSLFLSLSLSLSLCWKHIQYGNYQIMKQNHSHSLISHYKLRNIITF